jgi:hypothetical protein
MSFDQLKRTDRIAFISLYEKMIRACGTDISKLKRHGYSDPELMESYEKIRDQIRADYQSMISKHNELSKDNK